MRLLDPAGRPTVPSARCTSCQAEIVWTVTVTGTRMPVDLAPYATGNVRLDLDGFTIRATVTPDATPDMFDPTDSGFRYLSHFATCAHADEWRKEETS